MTQNTLIAPVVICMTTLSFSLLLRDRFCTIW
ncbi:Hok/Gef family protein [Providencia stuartii]|nr:Hok/Gef family protein [Providencia stuartii]